MNVFADMRAAVLDALSAMAAEGELPAGLDFGNVSVEPPRDAAHGDMATNAAMVLAKAAGAKPRDIAERLAARLAKDARVEDAEVAGPGFLNLRLADSVWAEVVAAASADPAFGRAPAGTGGRVNVEYVSANPTGPLHVGHLRGAVFGDALANLLAHAGCDVTREYYVNDGGAQVDTLARSVYLRYLEAHGREVEFGDDAYPGDYLVEVGRELKEKVGDRYVDADEGAWLDELRGLATERMMDLVRGDLDALGIRMDVFFSEKSLYGTGRIEAALDALEAKGLVYEGILDPPKGGKAQEDWEPRKQTLFRSTAHGDDADRPVRKSDGSWTYFAPDIAYHHDKITRGFDELVDVFGADHGGYVKRMKAAVSALSDGRVPLDIPVMQLARLIRDGAPAKMSKRAGSYVTVRDVLDQVGVDATRFMMLTRKSDAPLDFDFDKVLEQSRDNPVFYVQYAHARVRSVLRKAEALGVAAAPPTLDDPAEAAVARKIAEWPRVAQTAARAREPHRIAFYLYDLASEFHALWNRGNEIPALRFVNEESPEACAGKIALPMAVGIVISDGLGILGVTPAEEMR